MKARNLFRRFRGRNGSSRLNQRKATVRSRKLASEMLEDRNMLACVAGDIRVGLYDSLGNGAAGLAASSGTDLDDAAGYCVDIIPKADWLTMTVADFQQFDVLWIGADRYQGHDAGDFDEAIASRPVWETAIDPAEVMIAGGDYDFHYYGNQVNAINVTQAMVAEVADSSTGRPGLVLQSGGYADAGAPWLQLLGGSFAGLSHGTTIGDPVSASDIYSSHPFNATHGFSVAEYKFSISCHGALAIAPASPVTSYNLQPLFKVGDEDCFLLSDPDAPDDATGSVHGTKFEDLNGNGIQDAGESGLAGWQFYVDLNGNGIFDVGEPDAVSMSDDPTTAADETGMYWLDGIPAGTWDVREVQQAGWSQTTPIGSYTITIGNHSVDYTFTTDADFDQGDYQWTNHDAPNSDQLQIDEQLGAPEPIIWISNSQDGTISKFDTQTGKELGRYRTGSELLPINSLSPSRVAVMSTGDVWVANRAYSPASPAPSGNVIKILHDGFIDRNGNGVMDTSIDLDNNGTIDPGEIMDWDADLDGLPDDERIALVVHAGRDNADNPVHYHGGARGMAIDAQGRLWVGLRLLDQYEVFDADTGAYIAQVPTTQGPYGAVIDKRGILWSSGYSSTEVDRIDTNALAALPPVDFGEPVYGITADRKGVIWASTYPVGPTIKSYDPATLTLSSFTHPLGGSGGLGGGIAVDHDGAVWAASVSASKMLKYVLDSSGALDPALSLAVSVPGTPKAASIDSDGFVWTTSLGNHTATKIEPTLGTIAGVFTTGLLPYNYSDMTGDVRANATVLEGSWNVVQDSHVAGTVWNDVNWNNEPQGSVPAGTQIIVETRAADSMLLLSGEPFTPVTNNSNPGVAGRFVEARVTLKGFVDDECVRIQPILSDIRIRGEVIETQFEDINFGNALASSVHGLKWLDVDRDGIHDPNEPGLAGVDIYADLNGNGQHDPGEPITSSMADDPQTDADETGMWWLDGLPPGSYGIGEILPAAPFAGYEDGLEQTFPAGDGFHHVYLEPGSSIEGLTFGNGPAPPPGGIGNSPPGSVHGTKWFDDNGNGVRDPGEPGVPGVTIFVDYNGNGVLDSDEPFAVTMTDDPATADDEGGMYWLEGVIPGEWPVYEVLPDGWIQTFPSASGLPTDNFDFIRIGDADGFGYADAAGLNNANGTDANVDGMGVLANGDALPDLDGSGDVQEYSGDDFDHRTVSESAGASLQGSGYTDLGSDGSQYTDISLSTSFHTAFPDDSFPAPPSADLPNQPGFQFDFFVAHGDITAGRDLYLNVVFGDYDMGAAELRVSSATQIWETGILDANEDGGIRSASMVLPFYDVFQPVAGGYEAHVAVDFIAPDESYSAIDYVEISADPISFNSAVTPHWVIVTGNQHTENVDFGNTRPCSAHGIKWEDLNGNGARDPGEVGLPGITIFWDKNNNGTLDVGEPATVTMHDDPLTPQDETGHWWMMGMPPGTHTFREILPAGSVSTTGAVTITISPDCNDIVVDSPSPDGASGQEDEPVVIDIEQTLGAIPLTPTISQGPAHGALSYQDDGTLLYTPDPDFFGIDVFAYRLTGPDVTSYNKVFQIDVLPINDAPRLDADLERLVSQSGEPVTIDIAKFSSDPEGDPIAIILAPSSSTLPPFHGTVTNNGDGTVTYVPDRGYVGTDGFAFLLTDGSAATSLFDVSVEVLGNERAAQGDFNSDGIANCEDATLLTRAIADGNYDPVFDIQVDAALNSDDLQKWLAVAATGQDLPDPYPPGDVDLDGVVDSIDVSTLLNAFGASDRPRWKDGNLNGDAFVNAIDLGLVLNDLGSSIQTADSGALPIDLTPESVADSPSIESTGQPSVPLRDLVFASYDSRDEDEDSQPCSLLTDGELVWSNA